MDIRARGVDGGVRRPHTYRPTLFDRLDASTQYFCPQNPCDKYLIYSIRLISHIYLLIESHRCKTAKKGNLYIFLINIIIVVDD